MVILENIDIDIDIDKAILQNIDIDKISNRFKFGISNRAIEHAFFSVPKRNICFEESEASFFVQNGRSLSNHYT